MSRAEPSGPASLAAGKHRRDMISELGAGQHDRPVRRRRPFVCVARPSTVCRCGAARSRARPAPVAALSRTVPHRLQSAGLGPWERRRLYCRHALLASLSPDIDRLRCLRYLVPGDGAASCSRSARDNGEGEKKLGRRVHYIPRTFPLRHFP